MPERKPKSTGVATAATGLRIRLHPFFWIADYFSDALQDPSSKDGNANRKDRPPALPVPWARNGAINRSIPLVSRKGITTQLLIAERGLFLLAQHHEMDIVVNRIPSTGSVRQDCLEYLSSAVWDVMFSPLPPCSASLGLSFRMHVLHFLDKPDHRRALVQQLYDQNELVRGFIDSLPDKSLLDELFPGLSRKSILHFFCIARQTYSDYLKSF